MAANNHTSNGNASQKSPWRKLTWDDLEAWAGARSVERGRSYQRSGRVRDLALSSEGKLIAWVLGTERYATEVELRTGPDGEAKLASRCTCPVGYRCKHAVAMIVQYLQALKDGTDVPAAPAKDRRLRLLKDVEADEWEDEEFEEGEWDEEGNYFEEYDEAEGYDDEEEYEEEPARVPRRAAPRRESKPAPPRKGKRHESLRAYLEARPPGELVDLLLDVAARHPEVHDELQEKSDLASTSAEPLIRQARKEMKRLTAEAGWVNKWTGEGSLPNYSGLKRRLEHLLELGQADALLYLGQELLERGTQQVEQTDDEGETASEIAECLEVVFRAVPQSSRPNPQKLLYAIDMMLEDQYDLCSGADAVLDAAWSKPDWSAVADELAGRLKALPRPKSDSAFDARYRRDSLSHWLIEALESAGRGEEILPLCEAEAPITGSYERLVERLIRAKRYDDAVRWALEGIEKARARWPGIASQLEGLLRQIAQKRNDWPLVAAFRAEEFFEHPSVHSLKTLLAAAAKAGCEEQVRAGALRFLETGIRPRAAEPPPPKRGRVVSRAAPPGDTAWPLPQPFATLSGAAPKGRAAAERKPQPYLDVLLDLAIAEKRPDDVLELYDRITKGRKPTYYAWGLEPQEVRVAAAIAEKHPERALAIHRKLAESLIDQTSPSAYESALPHLRKVRALLHRLGRDEEWKRYEANLREKHRRKRRFLEVLDRIESKPIVEG